MRLPNAVRRFCQRRSVELSSSEIPVATIAEVLGVTAAAIGRWRKNGIADNNSASKSVGGRPRTLTDLQLEELESLLLRGATAHGWPNDLWTTKRIAEVIRRHYAIKCHPNHAWRIVTKYLGWTVQRPL